MSTSAESPSNVNVNELAPSFCSVLILFDEPSMSRFQTMSSASQSMSKTLLVEPDCKTKSASNLSALAPTLPWSISKVFELPVIAKLILELSDEPVAPISQSKILESPVTSNL